MTVVDSPMFIESDDVTLFAIASAPEFGGDLGVLLLPAGGYTFTPQRNRWGVDLAHRLAAAGHPVVRYDWEGIGDSTGTVDTFALDKPAVGDALAALGALEANQRVLMGQCYGARTVMAMAAEVDRLAGVVLISPPVRDHARGEGTATKKAYEMSAGGYLKEGARKLDLSMLKDRTELVGSPASGGPSSGPGGRSSPPASVPPTRRPGSAHRSFRNSSGSSTTGCRRCSYTGVTRTTSRSSPRPGRAGLASCSSEAARLCRSR